MKAIISEQRLPIINYTTLPNRSFNEHLEVKDKEFVINSTQHSTIIARRVDPPAQLLLAINHNGSMVLHPTSYYEATRVLAQTTEVVIDNKTITETFGTSKARKRFAQNKNTIRNIESKTKTTVKPSVSVLPPHTQTKDVRNIYKIGDLIPDLQVPDSPSLTKFVELRAHYKHVSARVLLFLDLLLRFIKLRDDEINNPEKLDALHAGALRDFLLQFYTTYESYGLIKYKSTKEQKQRIRLVACAIALIVDECATDVGLLAEAMGTSMKDIERYLRVLGCRIATYESQSVLFKAYVKKGMKIAILFKAPSLNK